MVLFCYSIAPLANILNVVEVAVANIKEIDWKQAALDDLHIPQGRRRLCKLFPKPMSSGP